MAIDIQGLPGGLVQNAGDGTQAGQVQAGTGQTGPPQPQGGADTVNFTDSANRLNNLEGTLNSLPVVDSQKVEGVQRQLATGTFNVDPASSAEKLLQFERDLP